MKHKEKAEELVKNFSTYVDYQEDDCFSEREKMMINAKNCALIAVKEILQLFEDTNGSDYRLAYWREVKQEIQKL